MGYHWKTCGYPVLQAFVNAQYSEAGQLDTLVRFLRASPAIVSAIKSKNWSKAAQLYNGPAYKKTRTTINWRRHIKIRGV